MSLPEKSLVARSSVPLGRRAGLCYRISHQSEGPRNPEWIEEEGDDEDHLQL